MPASGAGASIFPAWAKGPKAGAAPSTLGNGLIHYWKLDEASGNRADSVGTWTLTTAGNNGVTGISGKCPDPAGNSVIGSLTPFNAAAGTSLTLSAWVYGTGLLGGSTIGLQGAAASILLSTANATTASASIFDDAEGGGGTASGAITSGAWNLLVLTFDVATLTITLYINGSATPIGTAQAAAAMTMTQFMAKNIGTLSNKNDEIGVWNRKLSTTEMAELYNSGTGKFYPF